MLIGLYANVLCIPVCSAYRDDVNGRITRRIVQYRAAQDESLIKVFTWTYFVQSTVKKP